MRASNSDYNPAKYKIMLHTERYVDVTKFIGLSTEIILEAYNLVKT